MEDGVGRHHVLQRRPRPSNLVPWGALGRPKGRWEKGGYGIQYLAFSSVLLTCKESLSTPLVIDHDCSYKLGTFKPDKATCQNGSRVCYDKFS